MSITLEEAISHREKNALDLQRTYSRYSNDASKIPRQEEEIKSHEAKLREYSGNTTSNKYRAYFYEHRNRTGRNFYMKPGESKGGLSSSWNDEISSVKIGSGVYADMFEHSNFRGKKFFHGPGNQWSGRGDTVSSIRVFLTSQEAAQKRSRESLLNTAKKNLSQYKYAQSRMPPLKKRIDKINAELDHLRKLQERPDYKPMKDGAVSIKVNAAGAHDAGGFQGSAEILVNGVTVITNASGVVGTTSRVGLNVAAISPTDGKVRYVRICDTAAETVRAITAAPHGYLVVVAAKGDVRDIIVNKEVRTALESIGAKHSASITALSSYCLIGFKGAPKGVALESFIRTSSGAVVSEEMVIDQDVLFKDSIKKARPCVVTSSYGSVTGMSDASIILRGDEILEGDSFPKDGLNCVAFDPDTGSAYSIETFDSGSHLKFIKWLLDLNEGSMFSVVVKGSVALTRDSLSAIKQMIRGMTIETLEGGNSYALIGRIDPDGTPVALKERSNDSGSVQVRLTYINDEMKGQIVDSEMATGDPFDRKKVDLRARSVTAADTDSTSALISMNGRILIGPDATSAHATSVAGVNIVAIDSRTGAVIKIAGYDTAINDDASLWLAKFAAGLPEHSIVAGSLAGFATKKLSDSGLLALQSFGVHTGSRSDADESLGEAFAFVGRKGAPVGTATQTEDDDRDGIAEARMTCLFDESEVVDRAELPRVRLDVRSGGLEHGDHAYIAIEDNIIVGPSYEEPIEEMGDGLNVAAFDGTTLELIDVDNFHVSQSPEARTRLVQWIEELPEGTVVAVAAMGECQLANLGAVQMKALDSVGAYSANQVADDSSFASIGRKGSPKKLDLPDALSSVGSVSVTHYVEPALIRQKKRQVRLVAEAGNSASGSSYARIRVDGRAIVGEAPAEMDETKEVEPEIAVASEPDSSFNASFISASSGEVLKAAEYKTTGGKKLAQDMASFQRGTIVVVACAGNDLSTGEYAEPLARIGATKYVNVNNIDSYCAYGMIDGALGSAVEDIEQGDVTEEDAAPARVYYAFAPTNTPWTLEAHSAASYNTKDMGHGDICEIWLNHSQLVGEASGGAHFVAGKGINLAIVDHETGIVARVDSFDISDESSKEQDRLLNALLSLQDGNVIAMSLNGAIFAPKFKDELLNRMSELGATQFKELAGGKPNEAESYVFSVVVGKEDTSREVLRRKRDGLFASVAVEFVRTSIEPVSEVARDGVLVDDSKGAVSATLTPIPCSDGYEEGRVFRCQFRCGAATRVEVSSDEECDVLIGGKPFPLGPMEHAIIQTESGEVTVTFRCDDDSFNVPTFTFRAEGSNRMYSASPAEMSGTQEALSSLNPSKMRSAIDPLTGEKVVPENVLDSHLQSVTSAVARVVPLAGSVEKNSAINSQDLPGGSSANVASSVTSDVMGGVQPAKMSHVERAFTLQFDGSTSVKAVDLPQNASVALKFNPATKRQEMNLIGGPESPELKVLSRGLFSRIGRRLKRGYKKAKAGLKKVGRVAWRGLKKGAKFVKDVAVTAGKALVSGAKKAYQKAKMVVSVVKDGIVSAIEYAVDNLIGPALGAIWDVVSTVIDKAGMVLGRVAGFIMETIGGLIGFAPSDILNARDAIIAGVDAGLPKIEQVASLWVNEINARDKIEDADLSQVHDDSTIAENERDSNQDNGPPTYTPEGQTMSRDMSASGDWFTEKIVDKLNDLFGFDLPNISHTSTVIVDLMKDGLGLTSDVMEAISDALVAVFSNLTNLRNMTGRKLLEEIQNIGDVLKETWDFTKKALTRFISAILKDLLEIWNWSKSTKVNIPGLTGFYKGFFGVESVSLAELLMTGPGVVYALALAVKKGIGKLVDTIRPRELVTGSKVSIKSKQPEMLVASRSITPSSNDSSKLGLQVTAASILGLRFFVRAGIVVAAPKTNATQERKDKAKNLQRTLFVLGQVLSLTSSSLVAASHGGDLSDNRNLRTRTIMGFVRVTLSSAIIGYTHFWTDNTLLGAQIPLFDQVSKGLGVVLTVAVMITGIITDTTAGGALDNGRSQLLWSLSLVSQTVAIVGVGLHGQKKIGPKLRIASEFLSTASVVTSRALAIQVLQDPTFLQSDPQTPQ